MKKVVLNSTNAPAAIGPYSQGILTGDFIFVSGQLPIDPATGNFPSDNIYDLTMQSLNNVEAILKESGKDRSDIVKVTVLLKDINEFAEMNKAYAEFFGETKPARSAFQVSALPKDAKVEIEAIAY